MEEINSIFGASGWVGYTLLGLSVISLSLALLKALNLMSEGWDSTIAYGEANTGKLAGRLFSQTSERLKNAGHAHAAEVIRIDADAVITGALKSGLRPLELIAGIAPLMGLLGTVLGMITAFQAMEAAGASVDPSVLSGGIWAALLTTAIGLVVAIPTLALHAALDSWTDRLRQGMNARLNTLEVPTLTNAHSEIPQQYGFAAA